MMAGWSWIEEWRHEWATAVSRTLTRVVGEGAPLVIITDRDREWFAKYLISMLNRADKKRPFLLPFFGAAEFMPHYDRCAAVGDFALVENMLSIAFGERFAYWYVGIADDARAEAPRGRDGSLIWSLGESGEESLNGFTLFQNDPILDIKLMHLARLFDKTIDAIIFGK
jgi:hypothetical protein